MFLSLFIGLVSHRGITRGEAETDCELVRILAELDPTIAVINAILRNTDIDWWIFPALEVNFTFQIYFEFFLCYSYQELRNGSGGAQSGTNGHQNQVGNTLIEGQFLSPGRVPTNALDAMLAK